MDFSWTEEQKLIRKTVREFGKRQIRPRLMELEKNERIPDEIIRSMAKLGLLGMTVSSEYGGASADALTVGIVAEEIARADISCAIPTYFLVQAAWGHILNKYGTKEVKEAVLPQVTKGTAFLGIAATESDVGSDLANMVTTAKKMGGKYIINGEKTYISGVKEVVSQLPDGGGHLTLVRTDIGRGTRGMSLFFIPLKTKIGITTSLLEDWGRTGISSGGFFMDNVEIPESYRVGEENKGFYISMEGFDYARAIISVVCCGVAMSALEQSMEYIKQRHAFGEPIGRFEGVQLKLAEHYAKLDALKLLSYKALWMYINEQNNKCDRFEVTKTCAEAKLLAPHAAFTAINDAIQWFGAFGYTKECPLNLALRGVRSYYWAEGAREIMGIIVARELLGNEFVAYR